MIYVIAYLGLISIYINKLIFYTLVEMNINNGCEILTVHYRLKKNAVKSRKGFWKRAAKTSEILKI